MHASKFGGGAPIHTTSCARCAFCSPPPSARERERERVCIHYESTIRCSAPSSMCLLWRRLHGRCGRRLLGGLVNLPALASRTELVLDLAYHLSTAEGASATWQLPSQPRLAPPRRAAARRQSGGGSERRLACRPLNGCGTSRIAASMAQWCWWRRERWRRDLWRRER